LFIYVLPRLEFEYDFRKLKSDLIEYDKERAIINSFPGNKNTSAAIVIMNSYEDIPATRKVIEEKMKDDNSSIGGFMALDWAWPFPEMQKRRMKIIDEIKKLLDDDALKLLKGEDRKNADEIRSYLDVEFLPLEKVPPYTTTFFSPRHGPVGSYGYALAKYSLDLRDGRNAMRFANEIRDIETDRGTFHGSSQEVVFADVLGLMLHDSKSAILLSSILIFILILIDFGKLKHAVLVLTPLVTGTMLMLILLYSFGSRLSFYSIIVIPLVIGIGVDDGIHLYHRYLQEGKGSIMKTLQTTGHAVLITSVTTFFGFFGLSLSQHNGLQSIGFLAMAGIFGCFITSIIILPAFIQIMEDFSDKRSARKSKQNTVDNGKSVPV